MTATPKPDVLADFDELIETAAQCLVSTSRIERLQSLRSKLAALVEAARPFDIPVPTEYENHHRVKTIRRAWEIRALSAALRDLGL
jgi:hypothetical protein